MLMRTKAAVYLTTSYVGAVALGTLTATLGINPYFYFLALWIGLWIGLPTVLLKCPHCRRTAVPLFGTLRFRDLDEIGPNCRWCRQPF
jgi:hypothetical protein